MEIHVNRISEDIKANTALKLLEFTECKAVICLFSPLQRKWCSFKNTTVNISFCRKTYQPFTCDITKFQMQISDKDPLYKVFYVVFSCFDTIVDKDDTFSKSLYSFHITKIRIEQDKVSECSLIATASEKSIKLNF